MRRNKECSTEQPKQRNDSSKRRRDLDGNDLRARFSILNPQNLLSDRESGTSFPSRRREEEMIAPKNVLLNSFCRNLKINFETQKLLDNAWVTLHIHTHTIGEGVKF